MSGIAGLFNRDGLRADEQIARAMVESMRHRGPDGLATAQSGCAACGHAMLQSTPESLREVLPLRSATDASLLTYDGRLDNRAELIALLGEHLAAIDTPPTDGELLMAAYARWGEACTEHLLGDYAFAVYDASREGVFCARDHFGVKPFYYALTPEWFVFASEPKALFASRLVSDEFDAAKLDEMLVGICDDVAGTIYPAVSRLPPAHTLFVGASEARFAKYWELDPDRSIELADDAAYAREFLRLFQQAVECRLRCAYPVGALLSGGLDSSSISAVAAASLHPSGSKMQTFSGVYPDYPECDEAEYIKLTAAHIGAESHLIKMCGSNPFAELEELSKQHDGPVVGIGMYSSAWLYREAATKGARVLLDGHDGDSTVSLGFGYLTELAMKGRWLTLWREAAPIAPSYGTSPGMLFRQHWEAALMHPRRRRGKIALRAIRAYFALRRLTLPPLHATARLGTELKQFWELLRNRDPQYIETLRMRRQRQIMRSGVYETEREAHFLALTQPLQASALESLDKTAAAEQIEPRYPFWDKRLVEFCLALPARQKLRRGFTRFVMRMAMNGFIPTEIQWRRDKTDFAAAVCGDFTKYGQSQLAELTKPDVDLSLFISPEDAAAACSSFAEKPAFPALSLVYPLIALKAWLVARGSGARADAAVHASCSGKTADAKLRSINSADIPAFVKNGE